MIGNGFCNDEANTPGCGYDGWDCCGDCINIDQCSDGVCHEEGEPAIDLSCCEIVAWVGDFYCDDMTNTIVCNYDGGDCCGPNINTQYCSECTCYGADNGTTATTPVYGNY